jgi:hypothetical protein
MHRDPWHALSCVQLKATSINHRHNMVVQCVGAAVRHAGGAAEIEPARLGVDSRRPDIRAILGSDCTLVDVVITHPCAPSNIRFALNALGAAHQRSLAKHRKYDQMARAHHAQMCPFVIESFGAFGQEAQAFCSRVAGAASLLNSQWPWRNLLSSMVNSIAVTVQKGNATSVLTGLQRTLSLPRHPPVSFFRSRRRRLELDHSPPDRSHLRRRLGAAPYSP